MRPNAFKIASFYKVKTQDMRNLIEIANVKSSVGGSKNNNFLSQILLKKQTNRKITNKIISFLFVQFILLLLHSL